MDVLALTSTELGDDYRSYPVNDHGKLRIQYFTIPAVAVAGDANTTFDLCDLPPGRVRVIPALSQVTCSAWGSSRVLDIGHRAYVKVDPNYTTTITESEDDDAFTPTAIDVSAAVTVRVGALPKFDLYSKSGVRVFATVTGGTVPQNATLSGFLVYVYE